jgi:hypothetical protein
MKLEWQQAPVKTQWGDDMVVASVAIDKDHTVCLYCERDQASKVEAMFALAEQPAQQEPVGVEWTPCMKLPVVVNVRKQRPGESHVSTREGITPVKPDDLIMRGVSGEEYPIGRVIFEQTYSLDTSPPAQRKPLTDERIFELASEHQDWDRNLIRVRSFARAIEAAHGIKENT